MADDRSVSGAKQSLTKADKAIQKSTRWFNRTCT